MMMVGLTVAAAVAVVVVVVVVRCVFNSYLAITGKSRP